MLQENQVTKGQFNKEKITMEWSFSYDSFVKIHGKKYGSHNVNMTMLYIKSVL